MTKETKVSFRLDKAIYNGSSTVLTVKLTVALK